ncbi:hypothetical protein BDR26DRAFT_148406 [Obelidium mucronatum]|nr:hypothetical protein BDR26DRAFT_148406 [Obelidium mucronatum]
MESFAPMSPTRPTSTPIRPPTPSIPAPSAPPPLETVPPAPTTTPAQPAQLTLPKPEPRKVTTRIYIESLSSYKTVILTNQLQADTVISELICILGSAFVDDGSWTLFEVCNDFGIERPLRDWEIVTDILEAWDPTTSTNVLILKPYGFRNTLVPRCIIGKWPRVEGRFDIEVKLGKWKRKYFILKEDSIYYKEREFDRETWLCRLNNFDVYTLTTPRKRATTQYCFALRSASSVTMFENMAEYIHFFCVDTKDQLADWVLGIRLAKNESTFAELPDMFADYENIPARNQPPLRQAIGGATHQLTTTGTLLDTAEIVPPTTAVTSLLSRSLSQRKMSQPNLSHVNQAVPAKPLLQFSQTPIYQHPGAKQEQQGDAQDVPMGRTKSKMTRQFSAQRRATVGTFVPLPVCTISTAVTATTAATTTASV